jgi:tRNA (guanine37-N1)-methyltransferase
VRFDIFTIFPGILAGPFDESIIKRAVGAGKVEIYVHDIREFGIGRHRSVDDTPYGGGAGMVMAAPPIFESVESVFGDDLEGVPVLLTSASGRPFNQAIAYELSQLDRVAIICGRYEGVDQRVRDHLVTDEYSIGDYVLTGGELPAAVIVDAVTRLIPGVIDAESLTEESHSGGLLEYPHYTRPLRYRGWTVPEILISGHHANVAEWRRQQALEVTRRVRPDLLPDGDESDDSPVVD